MHPHLLRREQAVLVFVDVQERLHAEMAGRDEVASKLVKLAEAARVLSIPVVVTEHAAKAFGPTIEPVRTALASYAPLHKLVFSCFGSDEFRALLPVLKRK